MIEISVNKFKKTISDLTEITKAQKDIEGEIEEVSFKKVLEDVKVDIHELLTQAKDLSIKENIQISNISYQEKNLRSIIYNLLSNSIKYRSSQRPLEISISTYIKEGYKVLEIKDNGLGISSDQLPKIFTMFKRLHTHVEGTGVGLYIVKRMVENNNGKIEVESEIEKGTVFRICFNNA